MENEIHTQKPNNPNITDQFIQSLYEENLDRIEQKQLSDRLVSLFELLIQIDERERIVRDK